VLGAIGPCTTSSSSRPARHPVGIGSAPHPHGLRPHHPRLADNREMAEASAWTCGGSTCASSLSAPCWARSGRPRHPGTAAMSGWYRADRGAFAVVVIGASAACAGLRGALAVGILHRSPSRLPRARDAPDLPDRDRGTPLAPARPLRAVPREDAAVLTVIGLAMLCCLSSRDVLRHADAALHGLWRDPARLNCSSATRGSSRSGTRSSSVSARIRAP